MPPPPPLPTLPLLTQSPLPVLMMSLTAVNTVSMETPTTALAYISGSSLSLHSPTPPPTSLSLHLSLPLSPLPAAQPPHHSPDAKEGLGHKRRGVEEADRCRQEEETDIHRRTKSRLKKFQLWTGGFAGQVVLSCVLGVHNSCVVWRLRRGKERVIKGVSLKLFPH